MTDARRAALAFAEAQRARFLTEYQDFLRIPSISTDPAHATDIQAAAAWVANHLRTIGISHVEIIPTTRHPVVFGEWSGAGPAAPTVLIYGHYDVQPADPLDLWTSDPFAPTFVGDYIHARGASDMKGQVTAVLNGIESALHAGGLPVNLKFLIEGEEEIGSPSMADFISNHRDLLASDFSLNADAGGLVEGIPAIGYALRGLTYYDLTVYGPERDLHSGGYGGVIHNPAQVLCDLVAGMHDASGRVTLPGFYDRVRPLSEEERAELARLPFGDEHFRQQAGVAELWGEAGFSAVERIGARPTLEVNGLLSGFTDEGSKTVLPAKAMAKISMRLVPDQDPREVRSQFLSYLAAHAPATVRWEVKELNAASAVITERSTAEVQALQAALQTVWGVAPIFTRGGGSVPIVADLKQILGIDSVLTGFSQPGDRIHSPNERQHLPNWSHGTDAIIHFLYNLLQ
jgi:acetylornithine deacetylase/succinyl-diaminopimelate desuccinylase-like protein